jgi:hypothetical protein
LKWAPPPPSSSPLSLLLPLVLARQILYHFSHVPALQLSLILTFIVVMIEEEEEMPSLLCKTSLVDNIKKCLGAQAVQCLPGTYKALSSNSRTTKIKGKKREGRKEGRGGGREGEGEKEGRGGNLIVASSWKV